MTQMVVEVLSTTRITTLVAVLDDTTVLQAISSTSFAVGHGRWVLPSSWGGGQVVAIPVPCTPKTKAMCDAPWCSLMPNTSRLKKSSLALDTPAHPKKKRKVLSSHLHVLHNQSWSHESDGDTLWDLPPQFSHRQTAQLPLHGRRDASESDGSHTLSSQEDETEDTNDEDLRTLDHNALVLTFNHEAVQWAHTLLQTSHQSCCNSGGEVANEASPDEDGLELDHSCALSEERAISPQHEGNLTQWAAARCAEVIELSDSDEDGLDPDDPHNHGWPHMPYLPAQPRQCNICINLQPMHLKAILKDTIKCVIQECAFMHGPYYTEQMQKDAVIQRDTCDLGIDEKKPFHHSAIIKTIEDAFFKQKRGSSIAQKHQNLFRSSVHPGDSKGEPDLPASMVAMATVAVQALLDEKVMGLNFSADIYEDSYNLFIAFLDEIWKQKLPAYHRLMSDLYNCVSSKDIHSHNTLQTGMWLLDLDGMDV
ncbi:hypothetical protein EI94DRAFT_1702146 [Lactarius quietus]|nr:hypothetical protein EI94DRAFT_1702146 [Lactarius quietus]